MKRKYKTDYFRGGKPIQSKAVARTASIFIILFLKGLIGVNMEYKKTLIIILASNERLQLSKTVETIENTCEPDSVESINILLSQHANTDCVSMAQTLCENEGAFKVTFYQQKNPSIAQAIYEVMSKSDASHLLLMCADGETDPQLVKSFLSEAAAHPDCLISASRWMKGGGFVGYGGLNTALNFVFQRLFSLLYRTNVTDATFGYFIVSFETIEKYRFGESGFSGYIEFLIRCINNNVEVRQIPALWVARAEGKSSNPFFNKSKYVSIVLSGLKKKRR